MESLENISEQKGDLTLLPIPVKLCLGCYEPLNGTSDAGYHPKTKNDRVGCRRFYLQED
jgi:hypothetical protein